MKRKILSIVLALLMCMMVTVPTFADGEADTPPERANIIATFKLSHQSGSTYKMWADITNPTMVPVNVTLTLYNVSYSTIAVVEKASSGISFSLSKEVSLSSGIYHLWLSYTVSGSYYAFEKTYNI